MSDERRLSDQELEMLSAYLDGALTADERSRLESRLQDDPRLRRELSILRKTVELVKVVPPVKAPRDFTVTREMLRARPPRVLIFPATTLVSTLSAVAAMLFVVLGLLLLTSRAPTMQGVESGAESSVQDNQIAALPTDTMTILPTQPPVSVQLEATAEAFEPDDDAAAGIVAQATSGAQPPEDETQRSSKDDGVAASEAAAASAVENGITEMETFSEEAAEESAPESETLDTFAQSDDTEVFDRTNVPPAMPMPDAMQIPQGRGGAGDGTEMGSGGGDMGGADMGAFAGEAPDMAPQADLMQEDALVESYAATLTQEMEAETTMMEAAAPAEAPMVEMAQVASPTDEPTSTPTEPPTNTPAPTPTATPIPAAIPLPEGTAGVVGVLLVIFGILAFGLFAMTLRARRGL